ncbi:MAG: DUF4125 family protein, partial [Lachnospiraceae bacterium]|nr:DUF4125 family protein [Lachnospiraceae bacterium]
MDIQKVLGELDQLFRDGKIEEVLPFLTESLAKAEDEKDQGSKLSILNELIGFTREAGFYELCRGYGQEAIKVIEEQGWTDSSAHATTLLNIATGLRASGKLEDSLDTFEHVEEIYKKFLDANDPLYASLYNNKSLLYQELSEFGKAYEMQKKAEAIVSKDKSLRWEEAVTHANLANTLVSLYERKETLSDVEDTVKEAQRHAKAAMDYFEKNNDLDAHYGAAVVALGRSLELTGEPEQAKDCYKTAMDKVKALFGENDKYLRIKEYYDHVSQKLFGEEVLMEEQVEKEIKEERKGAVEKANTGLAISKRYYDIYLNRIFSDADVMAYLDQIAVGLVGFGSDCYGYDDAASRDHDWGPGFCLWLTDAAYEAVGEKLAKAYEQLPAEFEGYSRMTTDQGKMRIGVFRTRDFYISYIGEKAWQEFLFTGRITAETMLQIPEYNLSAVVNGEVWADPAGEFSRLRKYLQQGYQGKALLLKLCQEAASFSQTLQYNYARMLDRGDRVAAGFMLHDGFKHALHLAYALNGKFAPHDKWLFRGAKDLAFVTDVPRLIEEIRKEDLAGKDITLSVEKLSDELLTEMELQDFIGSIEWLNEDIGDLYMDHYTQEMSIRAQYVELDKANLVKEIVKAEWQSFDQVINEGGRAGCQDDWPTFSIMRSSQYNTWTDAMLLQYLTDFKVAQARGRNMIMEKYGRMEETSSPEKWEEIKDKFPQLSEEKKAIMEQIIALQVGWMEAFADEYPNLAANARRIHTEEDAPWDTSYETYLRGEIATYSDRMLKLYAQFIVGLQSKGENLAYQIMTETVHMYGYADLDAAQKDGK